MRPTSHRAGAPAQGALFVLKQATMVALDVIRDFRPSVAYSCRQGFCGTCDVGGVRICVDRPAGDRLVLEEL